MSDDAIEQPFARVQKSFAAQGLMETFGAVLTELAEGHAMIEAPLSPAVSQQQGAAHAGITFALGDSAAGYAALSLMPEDREVMTAEMKIHLLAPAIGEKLVAVGRVIKPGRRIFVAASDVWVINGAERRQVATLLGTMVPVPV